MAAEWEQERKACRMAMMSSGCCRIGPSSGPRRSMKHQNGSRSSTTGNCASPLVSAPDGRSDAAVWS